MGNNCKAVDFNGRGTLKMLSTNFTNWHEEVMVGACFSLRIHPQSEACVYIPFYGGDYRGIIERSVFAQSKACVYIPFYRGGYRGTIERRLEPVFISHFIGAAIVGC